MTERILYLLGVVAVGWAVTVGLRALPFVLFAGKNRELPKWVERFGTIVSPLIIACLIVYSYSGLEWRTVWPYLAGGLTIGLQLVFRNPLVAIVAGTALYMCALNCGCASTPSVQLDMRDPSIHYSDHGIKMNDMVVTPEEVVDILKDNDIPTDRVIHVRVEPNTLNLNGARTLMGYLAKGGYTRSVLVTERHSESYNTGKQKAPEPTKAAPAPKKIRYKKAR